MKTPAGLIFDDSRHYIDHLAPFCVLQGWPLIVCEGSVADLARRYYPDLEIIEINRWDLNLPSVIVACSPRGLIESAFPADPSRQILWLPHGNSDKGWKTSIFEPLQGETALVYGQKMIDFIKQNKVSPQIIRIGNFRLHYWLRHRLFYETLLEQEMSLPKGRKTYLYAPTWNDGEGNGSFWEMFPLLSAALPEDCNLIVKIHPNTQAKFAPEIERLIGQYAKRSNIFFLLEFPPIYPLLNLCDAYIGDMSSIGYDFLYWKRPMYFLVYRRDGESINQANQGADRSQFLYRCGIEIVPEQIDSIFKQRSDERKEIQAQVYAYTFDEYIPFIKNNLQRVLAI